VFENVLNSQAPNAAETLRRGILSGAIVYMGPLWMRMIFHPSLLHTCLVFAIPQVMLWAYAAQLGMTAVHIAMGGVILIFFCAGLCLLERSSRNGFLTQITCMDLQRVIHAERSSKIMAEAARTAEAGGNTCLKRIRVCDHAARH
jgi:hypothetical protein